MLRTLLCCIGAEAGVEVEAGVGAEAELEAGLELALDR
jgi:hypothetical protein